MSYILDALKKSERERTLVRGVGFGDAGRRGSKRGDWSLGTIVVGTIVTALVVAIAAVWLRSRAISIEAEPKTVLSVTRVVSDAFNKEEASLRAQAKITPDARTTFLGMSSASGAGDGEIRFVSAMAPDFQRGLPAMMVNIHVYAPEESQRILYINNRQVRRGDEMPGGVFVEEIVPDGAILRFRGERFKLPRPS